MSSKVNFIRGKSEKYDSKKYENGIYFVTDKQSVMMGGKEYGLFPKDFAFTNDKEKGNITMSYKINDNETVTAEIPTSNIDCGEY